MTTDAISKELRAAVVEIAAARGVELDPGWSLFDELAPLFERFMDEGAVMLVKMDGERTRGRFDFIYMGGPFGPASHRVSGNTLLEAVARGIVSYAAGPRSRDA